MRVVVDVSEDRLGRCLRVSTLDGGQDACVLRDDRGRVVVLSRLLGKHGQVVAEFGRQVVVEVVDPGVAQQSDLIEIARSLVRDGTLDQQYVDSD